MMPTSHNESTDWTSAGGTFARWDDDNPLVSSFVKAFHAGRPGATDRVHLQRGGASDRVTIHCRSMPAPKPALAISLTATHTGAT
jgi:hypothetical protein